MDFLNSGNRPGWGRDQNIDPVCQLATLLTREADQSATHLSTLVGSAEHVRGVPAGAYRNEDITGAAESLDL